jgi:hypothetical protein
MLRQKYMKKYKEKSKYDDIRFIKEDDEYLLKEMRPVKDSEIKRLPKQKLDKFIDDILTDRKFTNILYASNAKVEIKRFFQIKNSLESKNIKNERKKEKNEPSSVVKKRSRREAYIQIRNEVDNFKRNKEDYKISLEKKNNETYYKLKKEMNNDRKSYFDSIKENRIRGFKKSFDKIREKLKTLKGHIIIDEKTNETDLINDPFYTEDSKVDLPNIKLNINNVYSRLYHNEVLLQSEENKTNKMNNKIKRRNLSLQLYNTNYNNTINNNKINNALNSHLSPNPKIKFKLKNALKSTNGKEFTIKINDEMIKKCFSKYSGGPELIKYLKEQLRHEENKDDESELREDQVNFYNIITEEGNSFLHIATMENLPELVKYFTDKGANLNIQNFNGDTPLHIAARENFDACTLILLQGNAKLDIVNHQGEIPFDYFDNVKKKEFGLEKVVIVREKKNQSKGIF